eukprot:CAMPEP_0194259264 /NCGR_PEP_ID=MMETSP0158-20130606/43205_1 /TAXON_ID=33649 /ORGANISM="Thalassionema nitzschioides, Strain L26-B" /LENGTH=375 /DNA_ID=CAMNT_0038999001 /DNA_START=72 /DNA_END=1199 /DNA_ORIENTATION=+
MERDPRDVMRGHGPDPRDCPDDASAFSSIEDLMVWKAFLAVSKQERAIDPNSNDFLKEMYKSYRKYLRAENRNPAYKELGIIRPYGARSKKSIKTRFLEKVGPEVMHFSWLMQSSTSQSGDRSVEESYADSLTIYKEKYGKNYGFNLSNTYYLENRDKVDTLIDVSLAPTLEISRESSPSVQEAMEMENAIDSMRLFSPLQRAFGSAMEVVHELVPFSNKEQKPYKSFFEMQAEKNNLPPPTDIHIDGTDSVSQMMINESMGFESDMESLAPSAVSYSQRYDLSDNSSYGADCPINSKDLYVTNYAVLLRGKPMAVKITEVTEILTNDEQSVSFESSVFYEEGGGFGQLMLRKMRAFTGRQSVHSNRAQSVRIDL